MCIVISVICYTKIYLILRHHQNAAQNLVHRGQPNGGGIRNIALYKNTVAIALRIQITLLACYLPTGIASAVAAINGLDNASICLAMSVTLTLLYFNSSVNPIIYCWKMRGVRQAVKDTIRQVWCFSS